MSRLAKGLRAASAAASGTAEYVDDVFSTTVYAGDQTVSRLITTGVDLETDGGLVWVKRRNGTASDHALFDTAVNPGVATNRDILHSNTQVSTLRGDWIKNVTTTGFEVGNSDSTNGNYNYVSYSFKQRDKFFKVFTYTGDGTSARVIDHGLNDNPGMIFIKDANNSTEWMVYHPFGQNMNLQTTDNSTGAQRNRGYIDAVNATSFRVNSGTTDNVYVNALGATYVAYVFGGRNPQDFGPNQNESVIKVGSYTGNGSASTGGIFVDLGWEPEFLFVKVYNNGTGNWWIADTARQNMSFKGNSYATANDNFLAANSGTDETGFGTDNHAVVLPNGFRALSTSGLNLNGASYVYMAIRRRMKPADTTEPNLFTPDLGSASADPNFVASNTVDMAFYKDLNSASDWRLGTRYIRQQYVVPNKNAGITGDAGMKFDYNNSYYGANTTTATLSYMFTRAPEFFDVSMWRGTGSAQTVPHNLGVAPEMMLVKRAGSQADWFTYHTTMGPTKYSQLNGNSTEFTSATAWNNTAPTSTVISLGTAGNVNATGDWYIGALFATKAGISKVGSYVGTGSTAQNIDCGFSTSARFVMIKHFDPASPSSWYLFDVVQGITVSSSPYLSPSLNHSQNNGSVAPNWVVPYSGGFGLTDNAPVVNGQSVTYSFYAIA
jgi:hypothetical protein